MRDDAASAEAALEAELAAWAEAGLHLPLWWRDDDATGPTPALDAAIARAQDWGLPLHLAVIPAGAVPALAARIAGAPVHPVVHGWAHRNHEPAGAKRSEFGRTRDPDAAAADAARGLARLADLFGPALVPLFVPPWNRIAPGHARRLPQAGYAALSAVPGAGAPVPGLIRLDTHLDPIDWRGSRSLVDPARLLAHLTAELARRRAAGGPPEPLGLLTHHLAHDAAIWAFLDRIVPRLLAAGAEPRTVASLLGKDPAP